MKKTISTFLASFLISLSLLPGVTLAQSNLFDSLDAIQKELNEDGIEVVDYSREPSQWDTLPTDFKDALEASNYTGFSQFYYIFEDEAAALEELQVNQAEILRELLTASDSAKPTLGNLLELNQIAIQNTYEATTESFIDIAKDLDLEASNSQKEAYGNLLRLATKKAMGAETSNQNQWGNIPLETQALVSDYGVNLNEIENYLTSNTPEGEALTRDDVDAMVKEAFMSRLAETPLLTPSIYADFTAEEIIAVTTASAGDFDGMIRNLQSNNFGVAANTIRLYINDVTNAIYAEIRFSGESQINSVLVGIARTIRNVAGAIAVLFIVVTGIQMVTASGDESKITEQKRSVTFALAGLVAIVLLERLITVVYGTAGAERGLQIADVGQRFSNEILGLVSFAKGLIGAIAVLMIILSGLRTIFSGGEEDQITKQRRSIAWVIAGIILIIINQVIIENLFILPSAREIQDQLVGVPIESQVSITASNVGAIIVTLGNLANFLLTFVGLIALAALFYGGFLMVSNYGNEEAIDKAKKIIRNALIGIMVIISSFALINTIIL